MSQPQGMRYPGSKLAAGCREQIIGAMPPHDVYVEPYLGGGAIFYAKRAAAVSIVNDADADVMRYHARHRMPRTSYLIDDAIMLLSVLSPLLADRAALVYCDPPYHPDTRRDLRLYKHEATAEHHVQLLALLSGMPCAVMLSGYRCALYDDELRDWHRTDYTVMTRRGTRVESLWCNFTPREAFHDLRYVGRDYRERERIKRKRQRWEARFRAMQPGERAVIYEALRAVNGEAAAAPEAARAADG